MNHTPTPPRANPAEPKAEQSRRTAQSAPTPQKPLPENTYTVLFVCCALIVAIAIALIVLVCVNPGRAAGNKGDTTTDPNAAETSGSSHVAVTYPTTPSRDSYLLSGSGTAIDGTTLSADSAILVSLSDYSVKASINPDAKIYPASMTKIMTLIVACENLKDASVMLPISADIIEYCQSQDATYLATDANPVESFSATDLLYAVGVISAADACLTLADHIAGSEEAFVTMMNDKVAALGLTATHFVNCTGLDDDANYSTVREMAVILAYALDNECIRDILSTNYGTATGHYEKDGTPATYPRYLPNSLWSRLSGAGYEKQLPASLSCGMTLLGGKTGYTLKGKYCLASFLKDADGNLYITVTAAGEKAGTSITDMETICKKYS